MRHYTIFVVGLGAFAIGYILEVKGVFLYLSYGVLKVVELSIALTFVLWSILLLKQRRVIAGAGGILLASLLTATTWLLPNAITSPRKRFYLLTEQVIPGVPIDDAMLKLGSYHHWSAKEGYLSFDFTSGPGTTDIFVVQYDPNSRRVLRADYSLD